MRRVNPFDKDVPEKNNFPGLSPLKPANEYSYGDSDGDGSSFSEDLEVFIDDNLCCTILFTLKFIKTTFIITSCICMRGIDTSMID